MPLACLEGHIPHVCAVGQEIVEKCLGDLPLVERTATALAEWLEQSAFKGSNPEVTRNRQPTWFGLRAL
jgi:hypothetical protein